MFAQRRKEMIVFLSTVEAMVPEWNSGDFASYISCGLLLRGYVLERLKQGGRRLEGVRMEKGRRREWRRRVSFVIPV